MAARLVALSLAAHDPDRLAAFWAGVLGWERSDGPELLPPGDTGFRLRLSRTDEPRAGRNRMHFDLTSQSYAEQQETVSRALALGGRHLDVGQLPDEEHVVLADPEGNELCVIEPGNRFLAGCGLVGALSCDGTREVGHFWSAALGWPLVWDQDEETAIQSPHGGTKITWGGPPLPPKPGRNRLQLVVAPDRATTRQAEVARLVGLGAALLESGPSAVLLADPDGNELVLEAPATG